MLTNHRLLRAAAAATMVAAAVACSGGYGTPVTAKTEAEEGYKAARAGYWQEAHLRFERALELDPGDVELLNNVAVALEAVGRFEEARATYEQALRLAPGNDKITRNHRLFMDFYETYVADRGADDGDEGKGGDDEKS